MPYVTIDGMKIKVGQYILIRSVFDFSPRIRSTELRPARVDYLIEHSIQVNSTDCISHMFAAVSWPMHHPFQHQIGKPYEIWCASAFETCNRNFIVPLCNFVTLLLTAHQTIQAESVLVTVPLIL